MKSFKSTCEDNITHPLYEVSILADIDDQIDAYDNSITDRIKKWIKENYECAKIKISDNPNKDGLYEVTARSAEVKNKNIISLTNGMFEWKEINDFFICSRCINIKSLEGAPKKIGGLFECVYCPSLVSLEGAPDVIKSTFYCFNCNSLTSLKGAPKEVGGSFNCSFCPSLTSLVGAPKKVGGHFSCSFCTSLISLEGAPQKVGGNFSCANCPSLIFLKGVPQKVGGNFYCYNSKVQFTEGDIIKVSNVKEKIYY